MKTLKSCMLFALTVGMMLTMSACGPKTLTVDEYSDAMGVFETDINALSELDVDLTKPEGISTFVDSFNKAADKFCAVIPPKELTDAHAKMSAGLTEMTEAMDMLLALAKNTDADAIMTGYADFMAKVDSATTLLNEASELYAAAEFDFSDSFVDSLF